MSVYVIAMACYIHGACHHGYFQVHNPALVDCRQEVMPMIEGHRSKDKAGNILVWHAQSCVTSATRPGGEMLGMI